MKFFHTYPLPHITRNAPAITFQFCSAKVWLVLRREEQAESLLLVSSAVIHWISSLENGYAVPQEKHPEGKTKMYLSIQMIFQSK
jgi:hypothetical protein